MKDTLSRGNAATLFLASDKPSQGIPCLTFAAIPGPAWHSCDRLARRHGVLILIAVDGVVRGKKVAALGACEPEVVLAGGTYIDLLPTDAYVDGTMVSAKGWTALAAFIRECLKVLGAEIRHN